MLRRAGVRASEASHSKETTMENIEVKVDGNKLVITVVDVTNPGKPSSTGKTR
jgi:hypothetical protein